MKEIYIGSDHAGYKLKNKLKKFLDTLGVTYADVGNLKLDPKDDYPKYAKDVATLTVKKKSFGILVCGTGQGVCIAANKIKGSRAVNVNTVKDAELTRLHNAANVLCLSGKLKEDLAKKIIKKFLFTMFSNETRHARRVTQINKL